jgi:hypothetical protein
MGLIDCRKSRLPVAVKPRNADQIMDILDLQRQVVAVFWLSSESRVYRVEQAVARQDSEAFHGCDWPHNSPFHKTPATGLRLPDRSRSRVNSASDHFSPR